MLIYTQGVLALSCGATAPFVPVGRYQHFRGTCCQLNPEDGGSMFLRNVSIHLPRPTNPGDHRIHVHYL